MAWTLHICNTLLKPKYLRVQRENTERDQSTLHDNGYLRKKERMTIAPGFDLYNHFTCMFLVSIDRKFAGDYEYAS